MFKKNCIKQIGILLFHQYFYLQVPALYDNVKSSLKQILNKQKFEGLSLTTDYWKSKAQDNYMALTINFIDENFYFHSYVLGVALVNESHTAIKTAEEIRKLL